MRNHRCSQRVKRGRERLKAGRMTALFDHVQTSTDWTQWTGLSVTRQKAAAMEQAGDAAPVMRFVRGEMTVVGWQRTAPPVSSDATPATLTFATMQAVANSVGEAEDVRLTRRERLQVEKVLAWPLIGDTWAVAVRPRISEADRRRGEGMLRAGRLFHVPAASVGMLAAA